MRVMVEALPKHRSSDQGLPLLPGAPVPRRIKSHAMPLPRLLMNRWRSKARRNWRMAPPSGALSLQMAVP